MSREREQRQTKEQPVSGQEIPYVIFHDPLERSFERDLTIALKKVRGRRLVSPGGMSPRRTERKAKEEGIYVDQFDLFSRDLLELGKPKGYWDSREEELVEELRRRDDPSKFVIAQFPWEHYASFIKIPRDKQSLKGQNRKELKIIEQSRETGITSPVAQAGLERDMVTSLGGGVGGWIILSFARAGAEHLTLVDGSPLKPHRGNRTQGPFIRSIGENQAIYHIKQVLQVYPYGDYRAIPRFAGDPRINPNEASMEELIENSFITFDEMDDLKKKAQAHLLARERGKYMAQITDAGTGVIVMLDDPNFIEWPFNGRLTPDVNREIQRADMSNTEVFMYYAKEVFFGQENITPELKETFRISQKAGYHHIPQSGRAASKAGAEAVQLYCDLVEGKITGPFEKVIT